jgi:phospholipid/cholesterol/gamma-HCH transport system substrate-binding protein
MNRSPTRDFVVGLFVLAGLAAIAYLSLSVGGFTFGASRGLVLYASFDQIGGLKPRAPVQVSGVKVGQVTAIALNGDYRARVTLVLDESLEFPVDTSASIVTSGLLGDQYISLELGGEEELLVSGEDISFTESAGILERLIGQFIHNTDVEEAD